MHHIVHGTDYNVAILIKQSAMRKREIEERYIEPSGISAITFSLDYGGKKKPTATTIREYLDTLLPILDDLNQTTLLVADGEYFKKLAGVQKADPHYGYVMPVKYPGFTHMSCVLVPNYQALMFNPNLQSKIDLGLNALVQFTQGSYEEIGKNIIKFSEYPSEYNQIKQWLVRLSREPALSCDIEAFSLKHFDAGIGSIGFAVDDGSGIAFSVDYHPSEPYELSVWDKKDKKYKKKRAYAKSVKNEPVRQLLKEFFEQYQGTLIWHNASYDITVLIYQLWMKDILDQEGMLEGLEIMTRNFECTKIITYLATNNCAGNKLGLKEQAHEFAGNYAEDEINNIKLIEEAPLLKYNLVDCLCTWFVMDKHYPTMVLDEQYDLYVNLMKPHLIDIIQMQLTGMCLDMEKVLAAEVKLQAIYDKHLNALRAHPRVLEYTEILRSEKWQKDWDDRKKKAKNPDKIEPKELSDFADILFNPNSGIQVQHLLYTLMGLPVIDTTKTGAPATGTKTLKKLSKMVSDPDAIVILNHLRDFTGVAKILTAFIPTFKEAPLGPDGNHWLFGSFTLGGTVSGRLSSKNPNLQQIPSGSEYAKVIKECFVAPKGWIFVGLDYNSLEDYISALTTKDPNKLKVYEQGFCGHCLRAANYFRDQLPNIDLEDPKSVNTIKTDYPALRQESKAPTFALTYQGTYMTLMKNLGWSEEKSRAIESSYHEMYQVSDEWVQSKLHDAAKTGYITAAFGLRVRTPVLAKSLYGTSVTPREAAAEGRTAGNALGQSWGLLNGRASVEFMRKVRAHPEYRTKVKQCAHIHDAQYMYIRDDFDLLAWVNEHLVQAVQWQEHPDIAHDTVKLGGELSIFYPSWANEIVVKNGYDAPQILDLVTEEATKWREKH